MKRWGQDFNRRYSSLATLEFQRAALSNSSLIMRMITYKKKIPTVTNPMMIPALVRVEGTDSSP